MDLMLAGMNGCEVTRRIKALPQPPLVVIVTLFNNAEYSANAGEAGADGFLGKSEITSKLFPLIQSLFPDRKLS